MLLTANIQVFLSIILLYYLMHFLSFFTFNWPFMSSNTQIIVFFLIILNVILIAKKIYWM